MKNTIQSIIKKQVTKGCVFDAHTIIGYLIQNQSDVYLSSYKNGWTTEYYHSYISNEISSLEGTIIKRLEHLSWSLNIHNKYTPNVCWIKL